MRTLACLPRMRTLPIQSTLTPKRGVHYRNGGRVQKTQPSSLSTLEFTLHQMSLSTSCVPSNDLFLRSFGPPPSRLITDLQNGTDITKVSSKFFLEHAGLSSACSRLSGNRSLRSARPYWRHSSVTDWLHGLDLVGSMTMGHSIV